MSGAIAANNHGKPQDFTAIRNAGSENNITQIEVSLGEVESSSLKASHAEGIANPTEQSLIDSRLKSEYTRQSASISGLA